MLSGLLFTFLGLLFLLPVRATSQTVYAVVLGNQKYVVGSSTLHSGLFRSSDGAKTWEHLGPENLKGFSMDAVDSSRGRILFIAAGNGIHRSTDYGRSWKITSDWRMTEVLDVRVNQVDPRWVYAATAWGLWRSSDGGESWENPEGPLKNRYAYRIIDIDRDNRVTVSGEDSTYFLGDPVSAMANASPWRGIGEIYDIAPDNSRMYRAGERGIWGDDLENDSVPFPQKNFTANLPNHVVHALVWVPEHTLLLAGTFGDGLFRHERDGWVAAGLEGSQVWRLVVKPW